MTVLLDTFAGRSYLALLWEALTWHCCRTLSLDTLTWHSCRTLLVDTDHSHRHLLCKRQNNCGATDHSHRHLLCKCQNNCGATDHSHRHLLCKRRNNRGVASQVGTLSGPLHSPLWRALRRTCRWLRTVADGCGRLRTVDNMAQLLANTASPPDPQSETGTLATHSEKNNMSRSMKECRISVTTNLAPAIEIWGGFAPRNLVTPSFNDHFLSERMDPTPNTKTGIVTWKQYPQSNQRSCQQDNPVSVARICSSCGHTCYPICPSCMILSTLWHAFVETSGFHQKGGKRNSWLSCQVSPVLSANPRQGSGAKLASLHSVPSQGFGAAQQHLSNQNAEWHLDDAKWC